MLYKDKKGKLWASKETYYESMANDRSIEKFRRARYKQLSNKKII